LPPRKLYLKDVLPEPETTLDEFNTNVNAI
jgi:hypothetical protein